MAGSGTHQLTKNDTKIKASLENHPDDNETTASKMVAHKKLQNAKLNKNIEELERPLRAKKQELATLQHRLKINDENEQYDPDSMNAHEKALLEMADIETGERVIFFKSEPELCDFCKEKISKHLFFVDGLVHPQHASSLGIWANMCPSCYFEKGIDDI